MAKKNLPANGIVYSTDPAFSNNEENDRDESTVEPSSQLLRVLLDKNKGGGKTVTLVEGFKGKEADLESLGKQLKTFCGTGGSVKDRQIIIQGDQREKVLLWLKKNGYTKAKI